MERRELHTLQFWRFVGILPDDFSLRRFLANFSVCHKLLDLFFVISEANTFRQGKVVINKNASFSDKRRSCRIAFFSILYSWQWPHKGLTLFCAPIVPSPTSTLPQISQNAVSYGPETF